MKKLLVAGAALLALGMAAAPAQALTVGVADDSNGMPFGSNIGGAYFQQIYNAASFGAGLTIGELSFFNSLDPDSTTPRAGTFQIYLSYSSAAIPTFDTSNGTTTPWFDTSFVQVFSGALPSISNGQLVFELTKRFAYDPSKGNLLMTVRTFDFSPSSDLYLDFDKNNGVTNSRFSAYPYEWNRGLVTGFAEVPEPATWALMIGGFGLAGATLRRRRAAVA
ncbi:MAG: PEPxxWA-CTERM sorting domain-containing protein [Pseudomonadota bacterium]